MSLLFRSVVVPALYVASAFCAYGERVSTDLLLSSAFDKDARVFCRQGVISFQMMCDGERLSASISSPYV
jgi:hypothetical protein